MGTRRLQVKDPRAARVRPALTAQQLHRHRSVDPVRAPWSGAARPRVGFASTYPTTRPLRADGRVPGGRQQEEGARTGRIDEAMERAVRGGWGDE